MRIQAFLGDTDALDVRVRDSFECSPGPDADEGVWLPIEEPALLASLERQQALQQLWFGVVRTAHGKILGLDACLQRLSRRLDPECELFGLALQVLGDEGLDAWLRAQRQRHEQWLSRLQGEVWLRLDLGPQVERLVALGLLPNLLGDGGYPTGEDQAVFRACRQRLFDELLQHLPIDELPPGLREARLQLDVGV